MTLKQTFFFTKNLEEEELKKKIQLPGLPVGWEKKLDPSTGRYYYIDHQNKATHWNPPEPTPAQQGKIITFTCQVSTVIIIICNKFTCQNFRNFIALEAFQF